MKNHNFAEILQDIGSADITSHVDFGELVKVANKYSNIKTDKLISQKEFLSNFGIDKIFHNTKLNNPAYKKSVDNIYNILVSEKSMGELFKVLAIKNTDCFHPQPPSQ